MVAENRKERQHSYERENILRAEYQEGKVIHVGRKEQVQKIFCDGGPTWLYIMNIYKSQGIWIFIYIYIEIRE